LRPLAGQDAADHFHRHPLLVDQSGDPGEHLLRLIGKLSPTPDADGGQKLLEGVTIPPRRRLRQS